MFLVTQYSHLVQLYCFLKLGIFLSPLVKAIATANFHF